MDLVELGSFRDEPETRMTPDAGRDDVAPSDE
jgi:hypothetical protein